MADCRAVMFTLLPVFLRFVKHSVEHGHRLQPAGALGDHERLVRRNHQIAVELEPFSMSERVIRRDRGRLSQSFSVVDTSRVTHGRPLPLRNLIRD